MVTNKNILYLQGQSFLFARTVFIFARTVIFLIMSENYYLYQSIISVILFHISLSFLKSSLSSLLIETNVISTFNLCILPKKIFIFICNGAKIDLFASVYLITYSLSLLYSIILLKLIL